MPHPERADGAERSTSGPRNYRAGILERSKPSLSEPRRNQIVRGSPMLGEMRRSADIQAQGADSFAVFCQPQCIRTTCDYSTYSSSTATVIFALNDPSLF